MSLRLDIPDHEPTTIRAGDTVKWTRSHTDYPASDSWELKYYLVKDGVELDVIEGTADGDGFSITIAANVTEDYGPGRYYYQGRFEKSGEVYTEYTGVIEVKPALADSGGYEWRGHAERALENIEAVLLNKATADNLSYSIAGRSLSKYSFDELKTMRDYYRAELTKFDREHGLKRKQKIQVRFS